MAFNSLPTYIVGDIITDTYLNQIRDNFAYLKGQTGTIAIESGATFAGSVKAKVQASNSLQWVGKLTNPDQTDTGGSFAALGFEVEPNGFAASGIGHERRAGYGRGRLHFFSKLSNTSADPLTSEIAMTIDGTNNNFVGFGTQAPQGRIHAFGLGGGSCMFWDTGLLGITSIPVLPIGSVSNCLTALGVVKASGNIGSAGTSIGGFALTGVSVLPLGSNSNIVSNSPDFVQLQCTAAGAVNLVRTGGSLTYRVSMWLVWT